MPENNTSIEKLRTLIERMEKDLRYAKSLLAEISMSNKTDYSQVPGVTGIFDGFYLVSETGERLEVPANYAAKSRLVYGDVLKMVEEDGKKLFKQITKVPRRKVEAVANRKEGKWYALAETGTYKISDVAAEFSSLQVNDKITIIIPQDNPDAVFAALDRAPDRARKVEPSAPVSTEVSKQVHKEEASSGEQRLSDKPAKEPAKKKDFSGPKPQRSEKKPFKGSSKSRDNRDAGGEGGSARGKGSKEFVSEIGHTENPGGGSFILGDDDLR